MPEPTYPYAWRWKKKLPERFGQRCRVISKGHANNVEVEFQDGVTATAMRYAIKLVEPRPAQATA